METVPLYCISFINSLNFSNIQFSLCANASFAPDLLLLSKGSGETVGDTSSFIVKHYLGNENSTDVIKNPEVTDMMKVKGLGINFGNLLKVAPTIFGHMVQIGTTIASVLDSDDAPTVANNVMKSSNVPFKTGYYQLITNEVGDDSFGLSVSCYDSSQLSSQEEGIIPKYVIPLCKWLKKMI